MGTEPARVAVPGQVLIASGPITAEDGAAVLPPDTTVWWSI
jgi:alpha-glucosidase